MCITHHWVKERKSLSNRHTSMSPEGSVSPPPPSTKCAHVGVHLFFEPERVPPSVLGSFAAGSERTRVFEVSGRRPTTRPVIVSLAPSIYQTH